MHSQKKKLVISQLALARTLTITSQANVTNYDIWTYIDNPVTALDWDHMDKAGTVDSNYVNYSGFVCYNNTNSDFDQSFNGDTANGAISTYYLNHDYADSAANQLDISNSVTHGSVASIPPGDYYDRSDADGNNLGGYDFYTNAVVGIHWRDGDVFTLNITNTTINDGYEALYFTNSYKDDDVTRRTSETFDTSEGTAANLDVESNINISNSSRVAGIALSQSNTYNETYTTESHTWDNNTSIKDSTVTSGSDYILDSNIYGKTGHFDNSDESSDYAGPGDVAMSFTVSGSDYAMKNNIFLSNSTLMSNVTFISTQNSNFDPNGHDSSGDGVKDTNGGWTDDGLNIDELNPTLDNGSRRVSQAIYNIAKTSAMHDVAISSLTPDTTHEDSDWRHVVDDEVFRSGVFSVASNNSSEWDTAGRSVIDTLAVNNGSQVNVSESKLTSDTIDLANGSSLNIGEDGYVDTDHLTINSYSTVALTESTG